ncbi:hypothetical protein [Rariglobus hedericola]|uniref:Uncharacterized protein n=1 Tax=Rariglobus hedericola TaxID=2597822 RepID=A0A556QP82_9BACT|nr:hypothetical protein [Rariglobus hedericola]TSJ78453.1 hypothetical protein FPL22_03900 [Rariglobus hedericola]
MNDSILPVYAQAVDELTLQTYDRGLYGKALCDAEGDESRARSYYIKARVAHLNQQLAQQQRNLETQQHLQRIAAWNGNRIRVRRRRTSDHAPKPAITFWKGGQSSFSIHRACDPLVNLFLKWTTF